MPQAPPPCDAASPGPFPSSPTSAPAPVATLHPGCSYTALAASWLNSGGLPHGRLGCACDGTNNSPSCNTTCLSPTLTHKRNPMPMTPPPRKQPAHGTTPSSSYTGSLAACAVCNERSSRVLRGSSGSFGTRCPRRRFGQHWALSLHSYISPCPIAKPHLGCGCAGLAAPWLCWGRLPRPPGLRLHWYEQEPKLQHHMPVVNADARKKSNAHDAAAPKAASSWDHSILILHWISCCMAALCAKGTTVVCRSSSVHGSSARAAQPARRALTWWLWHLMPQALIWPARALSLHSNISPCPHRKPHWLQLRWLGCALAAPGRASSRPPGLRLCW